jgi:hypothetical protein
MQRVNMKEQHKHIALRVVSRELMDNAKVLDEVDDEPETYEVMEFERSKRDRRAKAAPAGNYYMTSRFEIMNSLMYEPQLWKNQKRTIKQRLSRCVCFGT